MDLPTVITGPHGVVCYRRCLNMDSADYLSDVGDSATIHLADIGCTGRTARNSDGYFYW